MSQIILNGIEPSELLGQFRDIVRQELKSQIPAQKEREYMNLDECVDFTRQSKRFIYNAASEGRIPYVKRGNRLLFERAKIIAWLRDAERPVKQPTK